MTKTKKLPHEALREMIDKDWALTLRAAQEKADNPGGVTDATMAEVGNRMARDLAAAQGERRQRRRGRSQEAA